MKRWNQPYFSW